MLGVGSTKSTVFLLIRQKMSYFLQPIGSNPRVYYLELKLVLLDCQSEPLTTTRLHLIYRIGEKHLCDAWRPLGWRLRRLWDSFHPTAACCSAINKGLKLETTRDWDKNLELTKYLVDSLEIISNKYLDKIRLSSVRYYQRDQRRVAPSDWWNRGKWGLL